MLDAVVGCWWSSKNAKGRGEFCNVLAASIWGTLDERSVSLLDGGQSLEVSRLTPLPSFYRSSAGLPLILSIMYRAKKKDTVFNI